MQLLMDVDRELRKLLVSTGVLGRYQTHRTQTFPIALQILASVEGAKVPGGLREKISELWELRNNVMHTGADVPVRAFDLGLSILRVLRMVPRPTYIVRKANLPLYADKPCQNVMVGVRGVWLETFGPDGASQGMRIHPSTKPYAEGMSVGWEWNTDRRQTWGNTWYQNPETGKCSQAWIESAEFVGRDISQV
jgi:hypothetical protein